MRHNMILTFLAACSLGVITTGCSTVDTVVNGDPDDRMVEVTQSDVEELQIPEWFLSKEVDTDKVLTVTATDVSRDMQFAIDKATLNAKVQLAQKLQTSVQSLVRESTIESGYGSAKDVEREIDRVSKSRTDQTVGFYRREQMKIVREGDYYRAFVMLKIDVEEGRRLTDVRDTTTREERFSELENGEVNITTPVDITTVE